MSVVSPVLDGLLVPPFSPVSDPRLEWNVGLFSLEPDAAPCRSTQETSAEDNSTVELSWWLNCITSDTHSHFKHYRIRLLLRSCSEQRFMTRRVETVLFCHKSLVWTGLEQRNITHTWTLDKTDRQWKISRQMKTADTHTHRFVQMINRTVWLWD